jgi:LmbE family N-acetylglucosaminyl deacetylase
MAACEEAVAVLSPHLDDVVLSAWSLLHGRRDVRVVNVFTDIPPAGVVGVWDRRTGATDSAARMHERLAEDREALALAGREPTSLGFLDEQYRSRPIDPASLAHAVRMGVDDVSELWAPAGIGGRKDHIQVRDAALEVADEAGCTVRLYADLPYAVKYGWPVWVTGHEHQGELTPAAWWARFLPAGRGLTPTRHEFSETETRCKLRALDAYRTQFPALCREYPGMLDRATIMRYEVSWALSASLEAAPAQSGALPTHP